MGDVQMDLERVDARWMELQNVKLVRSVVSTQQVEFPLEV